MEFFNPSSAGDYRQIKKLYRKAFPRNERKPFSVIRKMNKKGKTDIWYFEDNGAFLGFAATINSDNVILIDYFAVDDKMRGKGNGTQMLKALLRHYSPKGVFLEIEITYEDAENYDERIKRKAFYERIGFVPMNTKAKLFGVDMELLGVDCTLDYDEYREFYLNNYGKFAFDHIKPTDREV